MKPIIILLLSYASVLASEGDIHVFSLAHTNSENSFYTKDEFTRDGQTNLIRILKVNREGWSRIFRFYHAGQLVGNFVAMGNSVDGESIFNTEAGLYCMSLKYGPAGEIRSARIGDKNGVLLDEFSYSKGVFLPVEKAAIERANAKGEHMKPLFSSDIPERHKENET